MSVIQKIQDKYAKLMAVIIALALVIFVIMLAFENGANIFRGASNTIGKVNGEPIELQDFNGKVEQYEQMLKSQQYQTGADTRQQAVDATWGQEINRIILSSEFEKMGMQIGTKELGDILYGANPPQWLAQGFTDQATGAFNAPAAKQALDQMLKSKINTPEAKQQRQEIAREINNLQLTRMAEKYASMLSNSVNYPRWFIEKQNADNSLLASVSFVREFYSSIPDSSVTVTDKDITDYVNKHKKDFEQEESRGIAYVSFSALPSVDDSSAALKKILDLKPAMDSTHDIQQFLESQGANTYYNSYLNGSLIQVPNKDSIFRTPVGTIYGPYLDAGNWAIAKMIGVRTQPDTVKVRHILVSTQQRDSATARTLIDSIRTAIQGGANFDTLCAKYSEDGTKNTGGLYEDVTAGKMVDSFNDFIFGNSVGSKGIVKTNYGFHYVEILSQKGSSTAYKVAYLTTPIETSTETDNKANNDANTFAATARDQKSFDANVEKLRSQGINKAFAPEIGPNSAQIMGLGVSRAFVKSIYDAKLGQVIQPEKVGDNWVVAIVTEVNEKGTESAAKARVRVEPMLRNEKKAELIKKKIGQVTSLEAAGTILGGKMVETADSIRISGNQSLVANEPRVIGAAFNPANKGKVVTEPIAGAYGVYVIRVNNVSTTPVAEAPVADQRKARYQQAQQRNPSQSMQALQKAATIKDYRSKFF